jgi:hypothetical protein
MRGQQRRLRGPIGIGSLAPEGQRLSQTAPQQFDLRILIKGKSKIKQPKTRIISRNFF